MNQFWTWFGRLVLLGTVISWIKGWWNMKLIVELWDQMTPWQFIFWVSILFLVIWFIHDYWVLRSLLKHIPSDVKELNGLKKWIQYPERSYEKNSKDGYHNLAEMIQLISKK